MSQALWVVVPAHNEAALIGDTLAALAAQSDRQFALLVVDNASTDETQAVVRRFASGAPFPVYVVAEPQKGIGCAVDTGFRFAIQNGASLLARTDADCLPERHWVAAVRTALTGGAAMAYGVIRARRDENGTLMRATFRVLVALAAALAPLRMESRARRGYRSPYRMHAGNNMALTAGLYLACGGIPRQPWPTDQPFFNRIRMHSDAIVRCPAMVVENSTRRLTAYGLVGTALWYLDRGSRGRTEDPR
jgi:glycosyltransferase involved in cell wall biosynthesis